MINLFIAFAVFLGFQIQMAKISQKRCGLRRFHIYGLFTNLAVGVLTICCLRIDRSFPLSLAMKLRLMSSDLYRFTPCRLGIKIPTEISESTNLRSIQLPQNNRLIQPRSEQVSFHRLCLKVALYSLQLIVQMLGSM